MYIEPSAAGQEGALQKAEDELSIARQALHEALKHNREAATQRLASQVNVEMNRLDATLKAPPTAAAALCELINHLNGLAHVVHETMEGLHFVDVRREAG